jgi:hypothetical protein
MSPQAAASRGPTLVDFFRLNDRRVEQSCVEKFASVGVSSALRGILERTPGLPLEAAASSIVDSLKTALDVPLANIVAAGWSKRRDLLGFADASRYPPGQITDYALVGTDKIEYTHEPRVQLVVNGVGLEPMLAFEISVKLSVKGAVLRIQNGCIVGAHAGTVQGKGSLSCAGAILAAPATEEITLPAEFSFQPPLEIHRPFGAPGVTGEAAYRE